MKTLLPLLILGAAASEAVADPRVLTDGEMDAITAGAGHEEAFNLAAIPAGVPGIDPAGWPGVQIGDVPGLDLSGWPAVDLGGLPAVAWSRWPAGGIAGLEGIDALRARLIASMAAHQADGAVSHTTVTIHRHAAGGTWSEVTTSSINSGVSK